jgi:hypothetical protein
MPVLPQPLLPGATGGQNASIGSQLGSAITGSLLGSVGLSQASTRQNIAQQLNYSSRTAGPGVVISYPQASNDWRVRVSLAPNSTYFYNDSKNVLLSPLIKESGGGTSAVQNIVGGFFAKSGSSRVGVVFPYTPQVTVTHTANYESQKLTHNNYTQYFYNNSEVQAITITADFTVQNVNEGQYLLASLYFFRSCTKMFFGQDSNVGMAGNPPPIVYLNGYGEYYLPNVPCVITSFSHAMPADVDYMDVPEPAVTNTGYNPQYMNYRLNSTRLPTTSQITLSLQPIYSRLSQSLAFSLNDFAAGALINPPNSGLPATGFGASQAQRYGVTGINNGGFL